MTVFELMELLQAYDLDMQVFVVGVNYEENGLTVPIVRSYYSKDGQPFVEIS